MNEKLNSIATEMRNLQTNIHDEDYTIEAILECLYDWEIRLQKTAIFEYD